MALEGQRQVRLGNSMAVVPHFDPRPPAVAKIDRDLVGAGIDCILDELLDGVGGPLDDLARRDLIDELGRQPEYRGGGAHSR